ncbi:hypothetical protein CLV33_1204 [Jejuia pallidilutea]|uniref:Uncharacterized protein n=1 Tax=Jejuia pallidilutea TaxID=504487 RepID=A0A362WYY6_9FLAO|nr:hypothetical protein CLV33_1204 [Jejuia pallidilutea]
MIPLYGTSYFKMTLGIAVVFYLITLTATRKILAVAILGYIGENDNADLFKDPKMLQRFQDISNLEDKDKECLLTTVDHFIKASKISAM